MPDPETLSCYKADLEPPVDAFKGAMRRFASGVGVITAGQGDSRRGLTATAISSVTMDPPTILVCVNRQGEAHQAIEQDGAFCVNILASEAEGVAMDFAGQTGRVGTDKFASFSWSTLATGAPALDGALANIDCEITERVETASHTVFFGRVLDVRLSDGAPLIHFDRKFVRLEN
ncbi:flavin reductase family protein [Rhizobium sp. FKL33]|uniref:flavin reductase family protein n=1 Tax=Rhizobium sp. FKL33 TaxID=2562307 RepID=UPI0010C056FB|nr:flavin reductase family protein [Rhizobium sp. FKL33]